MAVPAQSTDYQVKVTATAGIDHVSSLRSGPAIHPGSFHEYSPGPVFLLALLKGIE